MYACLLLLFRMDRHSCAMNYAATAACDNSEDTSDVADVTQEEPVHVKVCVQLYLYEQLDLISDSLYTGTVIVISSVISIT